MQERRDNIDSIILMDLQEERAENARLRLLAKDCLELLDAMPKEGLWFMPVLALRKRAYELGILEDHPLERDQVL